MMLLVLSGIVACSGTDPDPADPPPTPVTGDTATSVDPTVYDDLRAALEADGFEIREGTAGHLDPADCCAWETCYLFNPDNRYVGWWLPPGPGQTAVDGILDADGNQLNWRLRPDEAVLAIGRTPPPGAYFSYRTYLHDSWFDETSSREWTFFNLGDSLNQFVMNTGPGGPFDADFALVTAADVDTEARVRTALNGAGFPDELVNVDVLSGEGLELGLHDEADTFRMQNRMALFDDEAAGEAYLADPPVTVWRLTPTSQGSHEPLTPPPLRSRGAGTNEDAWATALDDLDLAIRAAHGDYNDTTIPTVVPTSDDEECPPGCNRDTFFGVSIHFLLPEWSDAFVMVYGVNHERTGKSVYSNFVAVGVDHLSGIEAVHSRQMPGSAQPYLPGHPQVDDLYAWKIARDCKGEATCVEIPMECPGFGSLGEGSVAFRAYTEASTATGPLAEEILVDRAILFTRPLGKK